MAPLRMQKDGAAYTRPAAIELMIAQLKALPGEERLKRFDVTSRANPDFVPSECLMHFLRASRQDNSEKGFQALYRLLMARVLRALPSGASRDGKTVSADAIEIRDKVLDKFEERLATDRRGYDERLDFFEIRFDAALARLRQDAQDQVWRRSARTTTIERDDETGDLSAEVEAAAGAFDPYGPQGLASADDRLRLDAAIDALQPLEREIIEMMRLGIPIDSQDPNAVTIAKALGKSEKTIRRNRDKAIAALRAALTAET